MEIAADNSSRSDRPPAHREHWDTSDRSQAYSELEHPADLFIEVYGRDLSDLFENALFALYDQIAELNGFELTSRRTISARGSSAAEALRALLSEALYLFESQRYIAAQAKVEVTTTTDGEVEATAELNGETARHGCHILCAEVKAVTYHQLTVEQQHDGAWRATVLFDV